MPNSQRFEFHLKGKVPSERADALKAIIDAAVAGAQAGAGAGGAEATILLNLWHLLSVPISVDAPTIYQTGPGNDVIVTPPAYTPEDEIEYRLMFSNDSGSTWTDLGYDISPGTPVTHPNGYVSGQIYAVFADDVQGTPTDPLA